MLEMLKITDIPYRVYKDECGYCFKNEKNYLNQQTHNRLFLCLQCYQAFCFDDLDKHFIANDEHKDYLEIYKQEKKDSEETEQTNKKLKLEVLNEPSENQKFSTYWKIVTRDNENDTLKVVLNCNDIKDETNVAIFDWIKQILDKKSVEFQEKNDQWKLEIKSCSHIKDMEKEFNQKTLDINTENIQCSNCDLTGNLWMCIHCGNLGCGREQVGIEGNSHALSHEKTTGHALVVKLGSLNSTSRDIYCYRCDDEVKINDNYIADFNNIFLKKLNLDQKISTEKNLAELNVEQNMNWGFNMTDSKGIELESLTPSKDIGTGLMNLGNSCYFNSVMQAIFNGGISEDSFTCFSNYDEITKLEKEVTYVNTNPKLQLNKLIEAIQKNPEDYKHGIKPVMIKRIISTGNSEFESGRQQDAMEFLIYFLEYLDEKIYPKNKSLNDSIFRFDTKNKFFCSNGCKKYKIIDNLGEGFVNVPLDEDLPEQSLLQRFNEVFDAKHDLDFKCPECENKMESKLEFASFPKTLIVNPTRLKLVNWQPTKTSSKLLVPDVIDLSDKLFTSIPDDLLVTDTELEVETKIDQSLLQQLAEFSGFSTNACKRALIHTNNSSNLELAMNWMLEHMEDDDFNDPLNIEKKDSLNVNMDALISMQSMGLPENLCKKGLVIANGNVEMALDWVFNNMEDDGIIHKDGKDENSRKFGVCLNPPVKYKLKSVICHKGNSAHSGHYVIFIRKVINDQERWVLFNDEKIRLCNETNSNDILDIQQNGYIYIYTL